jgi:predicted esterase
VATLQIFGAMKACTRLFSRVASTPRQIWVALAAAMMSCLPGPLAAQGPAGHLEERVTAASDTSQTYALYLPPGYSTARTWPVLFVLDPRGRALLAEKLFEDAAARLGWVVMSSYNTLSDGPPEPNVNAMNAMLASAQRLAIDPARVYLAGFSGTSRVSLEFAVRLRGHVAGVIADGGALGFALGGPETAFARDSTFAVFGTAGTRDFNYEEMLAMSERFRTTRVPYRFAAFDGPHSWPPAAMCGEALQWLELRAMVGGLRAVDSGWVRARLSAELARAAELEASGRAVEALRLNEAIARDYARWPEAHPAVERAAALAGDPKVVRHESEAHRLAERDQRQGLELQKTLERERAGREASSLETVTRRLHIMDLQKMVERGDSLEAASARRQLARVWVWLAFYEPRAYLANGAPARALRMLEAAVTIGPIQGEGCRLLREALPAATAEQRERLGGQCTDTP